MNFLKAKKGQGVSITVIIVAAIALIVMVVLWAIFTGRMGAFVDSLKGEEGAAKDKAKDLVKSCQPLDGHCSNPQTDHDSEVTTCPQEECRYEGPAGDRKCVVKSSLCSGLNEEDCGTKRHCDWSSLA